MMTVILLLGIVGSVVALGLLRAWVLSYLWLWFVVPLGAPPVVLWHAFGLVFLVSLLGAGNNHRPYPEPEGTEALSLLGKRLLEGFVTALFALGFGYLFSGLVS